MCFGENSLTFWRSKGDYMILLAVFILVVVAVGGLILIDQVDPSSLSLQKQKKSQSLIFVLVG